METKNDDNPLATDALHPQEHPLDSSWTLWYFKKDVTRRWESCLTKLCTVSTIEQLYR